MPWKQHYERRVGSVSTKPAHHGTAEQRISERPHMTKQLVWQKRWATATAPDELSCVPVPNNNQRACQCRGLTGLPQLSGDTALSERAAASTRPQEPYVRKRNLLCTFPERMGINKSISLAEGQISSSCSSYRGIQVFLSFAVPTWHRT